MLKNAGMCWLACGIKISCKPCATFDCLEHKVAYGVTIKHKSCAENVLIWRESACDIGKNGKPHAANIGEW